MSEKATAKRRLTGDAKLATTRHEIPGRANASYPKGTTDVELRSTD